MVSGFKLLHTFGQRFQVAAHFGQLFQIAANGFKVIIYFKFLKNTNKEIVPVDGGSRPVPAFWLNRVRESLSAGRICPDLFAGSPNCTPPCHGRQLAPPLRQAREVMQCGLRRPRPTPRRAPLPATATTTAPTCRGQAPRRGGQRRRMRLA